MGGNQQGVGGAYMESEPAVEGAVEGLRHRDGGGSSRLHRGWGCSGEGKGSPCCGGGGIGRLLTLNPPAERLKVKSMCFEFWCQIKGEVGLNPSSVRRQVIGLLLPKSLIHMVGLTTDELFWGD